MSLAQDVAENARTRLAEATVIWLSKLQCPGGPLHAVMTLRAQDDVDRVACELADAIRAQPAEEQPAGWEIGS